MLQPQPTTFLFTRSRSFINEFVLSAEENSEPEVEESGLEDAARTERDYLRGRLREELGREPSEDELDEWLRQHTEGY